MYFYNVYMHEIEMRKHGDHGAGDIDVWGPGAGERGVHPLVGTGNIAAVLWNKQQLKNLVKIPTEKKTKQVTFQAVGDRTKNNSIFK